MDKSLSYRERIGSTQKDAEEKNCLKLREGYASFRLREAISVSAAKEATAT